MKIASLIIFSIIVTSLYPSSSFTQTTGEVNKPNVNPVETPVERPTTRGIRVSDVNSVKNGVSDRAEPYIASYALVIGMSKYRNQESWRQLDGVKVDVEEVKNVLEQHGFQVTPKMDLTGEELKSTISEFIKKEGSQKKGRIILYFAGHGSTITSGKDSKGYIVPIDAPDVKDEEGFKKVALDVDEIRQQANNLEAKHSLFVFDSCFSGFLTRGTRSPVYIQNVLKSDSRQFISSGTANQEVPDESEFRKLFVKGLNGAADTEGDSYILASDLADYLKKNVPDAALRTGREQTPQYESVKMGVGVERGDMVFSLGYSTDLTEENAWALTELEKTDGAYTRFINTFPTSRRAAIAHDRRVEIAIRREREKGGFVKDTKRPAYARGTYEFNRVSVDNAGLLTARSKVQRDSVVLDLGDGLAITLVNIPAGSFKMGNAKGRASEQPVRDVEIPEFYMGVTEVTNEQWQAVARWNKAGVMLKERVAPVGGTLDPKSPAVNVSWNDAVEFCDRLESKFDLKISLPSEAEWEYAARAQTDTLYGFGNKITNQIANYDASGEISKSSVALSLGRSTSVNKFDAANSWGLADMHGNVAEWCLDGWVDSYVGAHKDNSSRHGNPEKKVIRGGFFKSKADDICSTCRASVTPVGRDSVGFRVVIRGSINQ